MTEARTAHSGGTVVNIYEAGSFEGRVLQWPVLTDSGALEVRLAETDHEVKLAQRLRYEVFYEEKSAVPSDAMRAARRDFDKFDEVCDHLLVVDRDVHDEDGQPLVVGTSMSGAGERHSSFSHRPPSSLPSSAASSPPMGCRASWASSSHPSD